MFSIFSFHKNILDTGMLSGMTDIHSHLLPGVDDGMGSADESYRACQYLEKIGVKRIFLTPHIMEDLPDNHPSFLKQRFESFVENNPSGIEFRLAGEYMMDNGFDRQLKEGILTISDNYVLVETSYMAASPDVPRMLYELSVRGYCPLIAHPERYLYMTLEQLLALRERKYVFQMNLMSLTGVYGKDVQKRALFLLREGHYMFVGSDIHKLSVYQHALSNLYLSRDERKALAKLLENNMEL